MPFRNERPQQVLARLRILAYARDRDADPHVRIVTLDDEDAKELVDYVDRLEER